MKRLGNISQEVETLQNFREAFFDFSRHKKSRLSVQAFEAEFEANLQALLNAYTHQTWHTSDYEAKLIEQPKRRIVNKLPVGDHVIQHAAMHTSEDKLRAKIPYNSPAGTKGRGTHFFYKIIKQDIFTSPQQETFYCLPMDIHHYFQNVEHNLLKREYRLYIKDRKLLAFIDEVVDSYANGIVLGVKLTQLLGQLFLARFDYNEATITDAQKSSTNPEDLKACLEAAVIPEAYKDFLTDAQIVEVKEYTSDVAGSVVLKMTPEQMRAKALEGYFVRDAERNLVYCPQGEILRQKSIKRNGMIRYCNKLACKKCKCKCTIQKFKEADFNKDTLIKATEAKRKQLKEENKDKPKPPRMKVVKKVVRYVLHLDQNKMDNRKCLSEHPFGTMKRALGQYYFLLKGKLKVTAEMGLFCLSYNLRRAISLKGVPALIASLG